MWANSVGSHSLPPQACAPLVTVVSLPHRQLAACYRQLSQQLGAGLTIAQSLQTPSSIPASERLKLSGLIEAGHSLAEVFNTAGPWLPASDRPFLIAAAATGRLPLVLQALAERHGHLDKLQTRVLLACLYPIGVLHFGALAFAFFRLIDWEVGLHWDLGQFGLGVAMILGPFWSVTIVLVLLIKQRCPPVLALLNLLPAIGGYRKNQALADFAFALGHLLEAGASIGTAWASAGEISNSPRLARASEATCAQIEQRELPSKYIGQHSVFPAEFIALYRTGEATGSLEKNLLHLAALHQEKARHHLTLASIVYPGLLFLGVAGLVLSIIVSFYSDYLHDILKMIDGG